MLTLLLKMVRSIRPYIGVWAVDRQTAARNNVTYEGEGLLIVQLVQMVLLHRLVS